MAELRFNRGQRGAPRRRRGSFSPRGVSPWEQYRLIVTISLKNPEDPAQTTLRPASTIFLPFSLDPLLSRFLLPSWSLVSLPFSSPFILHLLALALFFLSTIFWYPYASEVGTRPNTRFVTLERRIIVMLESGTPRRFLYYRTTWIDRTGTFCLSRCHTPFRVWSSSFASSSKLQKLRCPWWLAFCFLSPGATCCSFSLWHL